MSIIKWFNKPKWQSPNEQVRIAAIKSSQDAELLSSLASIIATDPSSKVQKAALSRIDDNQTLLGISLNHDDKSIRKQANKKLIQNFSQNSAENQLELFQQIKDAETIKAMAQKAVNTAVRKSALQHIKQQGLLSELLFEEPELELQKLIIEKIDQPATLTRLAQKASKKNSKLKKLIQAKLGDHESQDQNDQAIKMCVELEDVVHGRKTDLDLAKVNAQWKNIEAAVSQANQMRFNGAFAAAKMMLDPEHRSQFLQEQKRQRAMALLTELEQALNKQTSFSLKEIQASFNKYKNIEPSDLTPEASRRYKQLEQQLTAVRDEIQKEQQIPAKVTNTLDQINQALGQHIVQPDQLNRFKKQWSQSTKNIKSSDAFKAITQQFKDACLKLAEKIEQSAKLRDQAANEAVALIEPTVKEINDGHLTKAKEMTNQMAEQKKIAGFNHPVIKKNKYQLDSVWQQLKDLRNWQKWSNDKARGDIIDELKDMVGKALHPDAVMKKLKEVNERWYALEDMEKLPGDKFPSRNQKMWQDFRLVSKALFEPTQPFFEKRSEQQDSYLADILASIQSMNSVDLEEASERDLARMSRNAIKHLKSLDKLPPKERGKTAKSLRKAINRIDQKLNEFYQSAETKKLKLIEQAQALKNVDDISEAIESAKQLQQQWKSAGIVKQHTERKLWKKFRKANDSVFNRRDAAKQALNEAEQAQREQAQQILNTHKKQLQKAKGVDALNNIKNQLMQSWGDMDKSEKLLSHEYNHLLQNINDAVKQDQFKAIINAYKDKQRLDELYIQLEQGKIQPEQFESKSAKTATPELLSFFNQRSESENSTEVLTNLMIQGEFITGLETPEQDIEARMAYQVKVLSERMSGEKAQTNQSQATDWLDHWFLTTKPDTGFYSANKKRIAAIIKAMMSLLVD